jgi:hypothetical protein
MRGPRLSTSVVTIALCLVMVGACPTLAADASSSMRVLSELFADGSDEPVARSLTVFNEGVAWDFLELPDEDGRMSLAEIVLHDPERERVVVIDPERHVRTEIDFTRLERLGVSLAKWARTSDDRLVRWAGGPDFTGDFTAADGRLQLAGPRVRYAVAYDEAPTPEAAATYRRFADTAILLKALLHPGGLPPFPRLAVNQRLEEQAALPTEVMLEIDQRLTSLAVRPERIKCVHKPHPRLAGGDLEKVEDAEARMAASQPVDLASFVARDREPAAARQE